MGIKNTASLKSRTDYTLSYSNMRGVDFSAGCGSDRTRYAILENMYRDYESDGSDLIESAPGFRKLATFNGKINAIHHQRSSSGEDYVIVHAKTNLYRFRLKERDSLAISPAPLPITLADAQSHAVADGSDLYIFDGESITCITGDGLVGKVGEELDFEPYIPTTYINGEEYEQRNLLTSKFYERYVIFAFEKLSFGSAGLRYKITSDEDATCSVVGIEEGSGSSIQIPAYKSIGGKKYKVTSISEEAFLENSEIEEVMIASGVTRIEYAAFKLCENLSRVVLSEDVSYIGDEAFAFNVNLEYVYLGAGVREVGINIFDGCPALEEINYGGTVSSFSEIKNYGAITDGRYLTPNSYVASMTLEIPVFTPAETILSLKMNGSDTEFTTKAKDGIINAVLIHISDKNSLDGIEIEIYGRADKSNHQSTAWGTNFLSEHHTDGEAAVRGCKITESFDGRIFISGNKNLPNTVFYSARNKNGKGDPTYFGIQNYFNDGTGSFPVRSILSTRDTLAVFKTGDDGGGSIYYHTPKETEYDVVPKIYPVSYIHTGISAKSEAYAFFDEPLFLSELGLTALEKRSLYLDRAIGERSHNVNARLLSEDLSSAKIAGWCGYLVICVGGNMYLADSRARFLHSTGSSEYEWFYFTGIGTYKNDTRVYRYSSKPKSSALKAYKYSDEVAEETVYSLIIENETYYYVIIDGENYEVYPTEEFRGGLFYPARTLLSIEDKYLFFGTESGDVCLFNNDLRGIPPSALSSSSDFDENEYKRDLGRRIHPDFYSFAGHPVRYAVATPRDNCSIPHLTKSTVKHSLAIKLECVGREDLILEVGTDKKGYTELARLPGSPIDFSNVDFSSFSFTVNEYVTLPFAEKEKDWIEKDIALYREGIGCPFGVYSVTYRFTVKGKIKNR